MTTSAALASAHARMAVIEATVDKLTVEMRATRAIVEAAKAWVGAASRHVIGGHAMVEFDDALIDAVNASNPDAQVQDAREVSP